MSGAPTAAARLGRGRPIARPRRAPFVLLVLGLIGAGLCALLAINTAAAADEVRQRELTSANADTSDQTQQLRIEIANKQAPAALASAARALGMVPNPNPAFLVVGTDGSVDAWSGSPAKASRRRPRRRRRRRRPPTPTPSRTADRAGRRDRRRRPPSRSRRPDARHRPPPVTAPTTVTDRRRPRSTPPAAPARPPVRPRVRPTARPPRPSGPSGAGRPRRAAQAAAGPAQQPADHRLRRRLPAADRDRRAAGAAAGRRSFRLRQRGRRAAGSARITLNALRGQIVDRFGTVLAYTTDAQDITVDPQQIDAADRAADAAKLAPLVDQIAPPPSRRCWPTPGQYALLASALPPVTANQIEKLDLTGIYTQATTQREYPGTTTGANVIGLVHSDGTGAAGIEYQLQQRAGRHERQPDLHPRRQRQHQPERGQPTRRRRSTAAPSS